MRVRSAAHTAAALFLAAPYLLLGLSAVALLVVFGLDLLTTPTGWIVLALVGVGVIAVRELRHSD